ncbi:MAG: hypothetical protein CL424_01115 [Acidimicrobiaceae bacterium]|nr:hypothetical protein [Acidimicrobiaceae bacterium]
MVTEREQEVAIESLSSELSLLAAVRAALEGTAVAARRNVLVDTVLVVLHRDGAATTAVLADRIGKLFRTESVSEALVVSVLASARQSGLVTTQQTLENRDEWVLTPAAAHDVREDHEWAEVVVREFDSEARKRLARDIDRDQIADDKVDRIVGHVRQAIAVGCAGAYEVEETNTPNVLKPINFNEQAALRHVRGVEPRSARHAAERLLVAALNPDDDFGDQFIHLLVAGNVLHALATRRDLKDAPNLRGMRIVLDTSVLVWLPAPDTPEHRRIVEAVELAQSLDAEVIVPTHVVDEWIARFAVTDEQVGDALAKHVGPIGALASDPFIRAFNAETNSTMTWQQFRQRWQDPTQALHDLGVSTRADGNNAPADLEVIDRLASSFALLNEERRAAGARTRSRNAIEADCRSLAMIARWRKLSGPDSAFFVAADFLAGRAYIAATDDIVPVTMTLSAWLVLMTTLTTDDPAREVEIARIVSHAALRDSFFALSACYGPEEIVRFTEVLAQDPDTPMSQDELNQFIVSQLSLLEDDEANGSDPVIGGGQVLQYRNQKRSSRARRAFDTRDADLKRVREEEQSLREIEVYKAEIRGERQVAEVESQLEAERDRSVRAEERNRRLWRAIAAIGMSVVLVALLAVSILENWVDSTWTVYLGLAAIVWVAMAALWVMKGSKKSAGFAVFGLLLPTLVAYLVDRPPW